MKKITLLSGIISSIIIFIGVMFKVQHWPGSGVALFLGCATFAAAYAPLLFLDKQKVAATGIQKLVNISVLISIMLIVLGFLFKVLHWPGAGVGICIGHILLVILIPLLFIHAYKETELVKKMNFYNEAILLILLTSFSLFIWLVKAAS